MYISFLRSSVVGAVRCSFSVVQGLRSGKLGSELKCITLRLRLGTDDPFPQDEISFVC